MKLTNHAHLSTKSCIVAFPDKHTVSIEVQGSEREITCLNQRQGHFRHWHHGLKEEEEEEKGAQNVHHQTVCPAPSVIKRVELKNVQKCPVPPAERVIHPGTFVLFKKKKKK